MAAGDYAFGTFLLEDPANGYAVVGGEPPSPALTVARERIAIRDGSVPTYTRFEEALGTLTILIKGSTFQATEDRLDALLLALARGEQTLKLGYQDERYWLARFMNGARVTKVTGVYYNASIDYVAPSAFAYAASASSLTNNSALSNVSGSHYKKTLTPTVGGSIYSWPIITITIPGGGPYGLSSIWVVNASASPNQQITITRTFAASDVIVIDCAGQSVTVNGVEVDFSGQFLSLDPRIDTTNSIEIHGTASSTPTLNVSLDWTKRFL